VGSQQAHREAENVGRRVFAFYKALGVNGTAVKVLGDEALKQIIACFGTCENQKKERAN
jgi:hypothetical protein